MIRDRNFAARLSPLLALAALLAGGCGRSVQHIVVGAKSSTEQSILGEIVAQHLEHRLGRKVERRFNIGGTLIAYQAFQNGEISLYPEYTGGVVTEVLKEQPSAEMSQVFERSRNEMRRIAQAELFEPLGVNSTFIAVIRADDSRAAKINTLGEAAGVSEGWKVGVSYEFQQRQDGMRALNQYHLPMDAAVRAMDAADLFKNLQRGMVTMVIASVTDGILQSGEWKVLRDDKNFFTAQQACLLVRESVLLAEPPLRDIFAELSGKLTNDKIRKMNSDVDLGHRQVSDVAAGFLAEAGLK